MTQREKLLALLTEFGITPAANTGPDEENAVQLQAHIGGVDGWNGFLCVFSFNDDGAFSGVEVFE